MNGEQRKLVVFVPKEALDAVRDALFEAGAGRIGDYERCSWYTEGTGTFLGGESTSPSVGQPGREQRAVLRDVVRRDADRLAARVQHGPVSGLEHVGECGRAGIAAGAAVRVERRLHVTSA